MHGKLPHPGALIGDLQEGMTAGGEVKRSEPLPLPPETILPEFFVKAFAATDGSHCLFQVFRSDVSRDPATPWSFWGLQIPAAIRQNSDSL